MKKIKIGLIQQSNTENVKDNLRKLHDNISALAEHGAELVILQELHK